MKSRPKRLVSSEREIHEHVWKAVDFDGGIYFVCEICQKVSLAVKPSPKGDKGVSVARAPLDASADKN